MVNKIFTKSKDLIYSKQTSILSAATVIMVMIIASRLLGLARQRVLTNFFTSDDLSLFFAAFRLPDLIYEVLVFGAFSSAFVPVFAKSFKKDEKKTWAVVARVINIGLLIYLVLSLIFVMFAQNIYRVVTPGFTLDQIIEVANIARVLFIAQGFFIVSYVMTGVLESRQHFLVPALAPIFYNIGIIIGTVVLYPVLGIMAPAVGVIIGASLHLLIQLPLAVQLGFRPKFDITLDKDVREIGRLASPRLADLGVAQITETVQLALASIISTASFSYLTFANTLQLFPVGLFGTALAKAAMTRMSHESDDIRKFKKTILTTLYQMTFLVMPIAAILITLRIPAVRIIFGGGKFDWDATVQTGWVLTAFGLSIPFQAAIALLNRGFYALHDTKTTVIVSIISDAITIGIDLIAVLVLKLPVWSIAASFSIGILIQIILLYILLYKKIGEKIKFVDFLPLIKSFAGGGVSAIVMAILLKTFDQLVPILDTRYTINLIIFTSILSLIGILVYVLVSFILKSQELNEITTTLRHRVKIANFITNKKEPIAPPASENLN